MLVQGCLYMKKLEKSTRYQPTTQVPLRKYMAIQNNNRDKGSTYETPLDQKKYPLGESLTKIKILVKEKRPQIQPRKVLSKPKHLITF